MESALTTIIQIAAETSKQLYVRHENDKIAIVAPTKQGRWGNEPLFWLNSLNNDQWYDVPKSTKIELRGFGMDRESQNSLAWMKEYFGSNFEMNNVPM